MRLASGKLTPAESWRAHDDGDAHVAGEVAGFLKHGFAAAVDGAAAEAIGDLVLAQDGGHAFDVALVGGGEDDVRLRFHELAELLGERGDGAVEAQRGAGVEGDFAEGGVFVEHIDGAELVEIEPEVRIEQALKDFGAEIDIFRTDEIADAGALVTLLDLVPPSVDLVADHAGLVDEEDGLGEELEEMALGARDGGEEFPAGKDTDAAGGSGFDGEIFGAWSLSSASLDLDALAAEAGVDGGEQAFGDGRFSEGQQPGFIEAGLRALGFGVEAADGFDFVAEELDAQGAVGFGRVDVEDAAAAGELAGHFDQVHLRVADAGEVAGEDFDVDFFAALEVDGERGVVVAVEEAQGRGLDGRDEDGDGAGGQFPEGGGALFLHVGVRGKVFKREHVVGRETDHAVGIDGAGKFAAGSECGFEGLGGLVVGDDQDDRAAGGRAGHERKVKRAGGGRQSGDTATPRSKAEVPANAIKGGGVLQVRKNFADEREDHRGLV